jgi:hypothetical protein
MEMWQRVVNGLDTLAGHTSDGGGQNRRQYSSYYLLSIRESKRAAAVVVEDATPDCRATGQVVPRVRLLVALAGIGEFSAVRTMARALRPCEHRSEPFR